MPDISTAEKGLFRSVEICNSGSAAMVSPVQVPTQQGKENPFIEGKGSREGCKQRVPGFSLAEPLPGKKRSLSSSCCALLSLQGMRAPPSGFPTLFN